MLVSVGSLRRGAGQRLSRERSGLAACERMCGVRFLPERFYGQVVDRARSPDWATLGLDIISELTCKTKAPCVPKTHKCSKREVLPARDDSCVREREVERAHFHRYRRAMSSTYPGLTRESTRYVRFLPHRGGRLPRSCARLGRSNPLKMHVIPGPAVPSLLMLTAQHALNG